MFLAGTLDGLNLVAQLNPESMRSNLTDFRSFIMLEGVGHWPQLEAPDATNAAAARISTKPLNSGLNP
jgi:pimeloyl-ACP methyl ester carboxylesterase